MNDKTELKDKELENVNGGTSGFTPSDTQNYNWDNIRSDTNRRTFPSPKIDEGETTT